MRRAVRAACSIVGFAACVAAALPASAQAQVDAATRSSARQLGDEANALFDAGDYAGALDKYTRADALVHLPTLGVRAARCLVKLGRLVEASERYLAVTRMELAPDALAVHREAIVEAEAERAALLPRIPSVVISVGGPAEGAAVTLDGAAVPAALLGAKRAVDPGVHEVVGRRGEKVVTREISLREGESVPVRLELPADPSAPPPPAAVAPPPAITAAPGGDAPAPPGSGGGQRMAGFVGLGLGAVGLGVGAVTGLIAAGKKSDLESDGCGPDLQCPEAQWDAADSYNSLRTVSTIGFIAGGVAAAAGAVLILTAPSAGAPAASGLSPALVPWIGLGSAGVNGTF